MPVYDLSYRHWDGALRSSGWRWWVITQAGLRLLLASRKFTILVFACWVPFFIQAFIVYLSLVREVTMGFSIGPAFFRNAFTLQAFPLVLVTVYAGSGLIANDLAANALPIYFSKPITRRDYVLGKLGIIAACTAAVYLMPVLLLFIFAAGVSPSLDFLGNNLWLLAPILGYGVLVVAVTSLFILALSALTRSSRIVGVTFLALVISSGWIGTILSLMLGTDQVLVFSISHDIARLADAFFGEESNLSSLHWSLAAGALVLVAAFSAWILARRIKPVEVVA
jgi:ABC-type transport system involved in multi-copper enzyme maturation permease subunit